ncbi:MAG: pentapeptide repeat-containing protein [Kiloniellaceae bacterium]
MAAGLLWGPVAPGSARAACTDPPGPEVNWQRCGFDGLDLKGVDLAGARLRDGSFFRADLTGSDLSKVRAFRAKFVNAILRNANLDGAKLSEADFTKADLTGASLVGADLRRVRLFHANLRDANLTDARLRGADLTQADLSGVTWVDGKRICAEGSSGRCN